jgi:hypothetical protein
MSKTNHTSYGAVATSECELTIDELDIVSGAAGVETIPIVIGPMYGGSGGGGGGGGGGGSPIEAWYTLIHQYGF